MDRILEFGSGLTPGWNWTYSSECQNFWVQFLGCLIGLNQHFLYRSHPKKILWRSMLAGLYWVPQYFPIGQPNNNQDATRIINSGEVQNTNCCFSKFQFIVVVFIIVVSNQFINANDKAAIIISLAQCCVKQLPFLRPLTSLADSGQHGLCKFILPQSNYQPRKYSIQMIHSKDEKEHSIRN